MPRQNIPRDSRIQYFRSAADFWLGAIHLQKDRCLQESKSSDQARADLNFYVVAVQRLREVARQVHKQLEMEKAKQALEEFDRQWPRLKELRNSEEHLTGPDLNAPAGVWYFGNLIADLQFGTVEYIVHVERTEPAINELYGALCGLLAEE